MSAHGFYCANMRNLKAIALLLGLILASCSSGDGGDGAAGGGTPPADGGGQTPPGEHIQEASTLFVLGDSLSDVGNAAAIADYLLSLVFDPPTVGLCNPADVLVLSRPCDDLFYRRSRVSDGPVAVEHLSAHFGVDELEPSLHLVPDAEPLGSAYAIAGATARGQEQKDLRQQVDMLLLNHPSIATDAVVVVIVGGNDVIDALQASTGETPEMTEMIISAAVTEVRSTVQRLLDAGARQLVVANVPGLDSLPAVRDEAAASGDEAAFLTRAEGISADMNLRLETALDEIENSDQWMSPIPPVLVRFDLHAALEETIRQAADSGENVRNACFDSEEYRDSETAERNYHPDCAPPSDDAAPGFDGFVFWDDIHPTGAAHAEIGAALIEAL